MELGGGDAEQGVPRLGNWPGCLGQGSSVPPTLVLSKQNLSGSEDTGCGLGPFTASYGGGGGFGQRKQALARRKRGQRFSCLLRHPPPNGMDWQLPQTGTRLGSCPSLGARLQPEITAGWVEVGSKNKFQIGRNFV